MEKVVGQNIQTPGLRGVVDRTLQLANSFTLFMQTPSISKQSSLHSFALLTNCAICLQWLPPEASKCECNQKN